MPKVNKQEKSASLKDLWNYLIKTRNTGFELNLHLGFILSYKDEHLVEFLLMIKSNCDNKKIKKKFQIANIGRALYLLINNMEEDDKFKPKVDEAIDEFIEYRSNVE